MAARTVRSSAPRLRLRRIRVLSPHAEPLVYLCDVGSGGAGGRIASQPSRADKGRADALPFAIPGGLCAGSEHRVRPSRRTGPMTALATAPPPPLAPDRHIARFPPLPTPGDLLTEPPPTAEAPHQAAAHREHGHPGPEG